MPVSGRIYGDRHFAFGRGAVGGTVSNLCCKFGCDSICLYADTVSGITAYISANMRYNCSTILFSILLSSAPPSSAYVHTPLRFTLFFFQLIGGVRDVYSFAQYALVCPLCSSVIFRRPDIYGGGYVGWSLSLDSKIRTEFSGRTRSRKKQSPPPS